VLPLLFSFNPLDRLTPGGRRGFVTPAAEEKGKRARATRNRTYVPFTAYDIYCIYIHSRRRRRRARPVSEFDFTVRWRRRRGTRPVSRVPPIWSRVPAGKRDATKKKHFINGFRSFNSFRLLHAPLLSAPSVLSVGRNNVGHPFLATPPNTTVDFVLTASTDSECVAFNALFNFGTCRKPHEIRRTRGMLS